MILILFLTFLWYLCGCTWTQTLMMNLKHLFRLYIRSVFDVLIYGFLFLWCLVYLFSRYFWWLSSCFCFWMFYYSGQIRPNVSLHNPPATKHHMKQYYKLFCCSRRSSMWSDRLPLVSVLHCGYCRHQVLHCTPITPLDTLWIVLKQMIQTDRADSEISPSLFHTFFFLFKTCRHCYPQCNLAVYQITCSFLWSHKGLYTFFLPNTC